MSALESGVLAEGSEELARAEVYGLLSALFGAAPSAELHAGLQVAVSEAPAAPLEASFGALVEAARRLPLSAVRDEYDALFQGIGKPAVFLHASYFVAGALNEKPLVVLRDDLRELGLERQPGQFMTEDHLACLCEAMRLLIVGDDLAAGSLATQRRFFDAHLRAWTGALCDALERQPRSDFYRAAAAFARDFFSVEAQAFDMPDP